MIENQNPNLMQRLHPEEDYSPRTDSILSNSNCILTSSSLCTKRKHASIDLGDDELYSTDEFRMYVYKIKLCNLGVVHDWASCPFAHPGERARRRDPRKYPYSSVMCLEYKKQGVCARGYSCDCAHGLFEFLLHPDRYRTKLCRKGANCDRTACFFAHTVNEIRSPTLLPKSTLSSPLLHDVSNRLGQTSCRENSEAAELLSLQRDLLMQQKQALDCELYILLANISINEKKLQMLNSGLNWQCDPLQNGQRLVDSTANLWSNPVSSGGKMDWSSKKEDVSLLESSGSLIHDDSARVADGGGRSSLYTHPFLPCYLFTHVNLWSM